MPAFSLSWKTAAARCVSAGVPKLKVSDESGMAVSGSGVSVSPDGLPGSVVPKLRPSQNLYLLVKPTLIIAKPAAPAKVPALDAADK